MSYEKDAMII